MFAIGSFLLILFRQNPGGRTDYSYIWELVERYRLPRLRVSVTAPGGVYTGWRAKKEEYYSRMKPIFLQFCKDAKEHGIHLGSDCNHIASSRFTSADSATAPSRGRAEFDCAAAQSAKPRHPPWQISRSWLEQPAHRPVALAHIRG